MNLLRTDVVARDIERAVVDVLRNDCPSTSEGGYSLLANNLEQDDVVTFDDEVKRHLLNLYVAQGVRKHKHAVR